MCGGWKRKSKEVFRKALCNALGDLPVADGLDKMCGLLLGEELNEVLGAATGE
jgi:hypothetical protein